MELELQKEIKGLQGDIHMTKMAVGSVQNDMKEQLAGKMGDDIKSVLSGERIVTVSTGEKFSHKLLWFLKRVFRMF